MTIDYFSIIFMQVSPQHWNNWLFC